MSLGPGPIVRGHGGWRTLPHSRQAKGGDASHLFPAPDLISLLMDLNVPKLGFRHMIEYMSRLGSAYTAATGLPFDKPTPTRDAFTDACKELVTPLDLRPPVSIPDPPASGRSWPLPSWARDVQSRPSLVDTID